MWQKQVAGEWTQVGGDWLNSTAVDEQTGTEVWAAAYQDS